MAKSEIKSLMQYLDQPAKWKLLTTNNSFWAKSLEKYETARLNQKHGRVKSGHALYYLGTVWLLLVRNFPALHVNPTLLITCWYDVCFLMLVSKNSANKPDRKTSCSILPEKDRLKWLHHKMTPVWNYEAKAMFLTRGEACRCTSEVGLLLVCCIVWASTVTKPIQWPRTAAACWGLTSQVMLTSLNE